MRRSAHECVNRSLDRGLTAAFDGCPGAGTYQVVVMPTHFRDERDATVKDYVAFQGNTQMLAMRDASLRRMAEVYGDFDNAPDLQALAQSSRSRGLGTRVGSRDSGGVQGARLESSHPQGLDGLFLFDTWRFTRVRTCLAKGTTCASLHWLTGVWHCAHACLVCLT